VPRSLPVQPTTSLVATELGLYVAEKTRRIDKGRFGGQGALQQRLAVAPSLSRERDLGEAELNT
jgi:hypothetical protein